MSVRKDGHWCQELVVFGDMTSVEPTCLLAYTITQKKANVEGFFCKTVISLSWLSPSCSPFHSYSLAAT
jgi:hypothetical protein